MGVSKSLTIYDGLWGLSLLGFAVFAWLPDSYFRMVGWPWTLVWQGAFLCAVSACIWQLRRFHQPFYRLGFGFDWLILGLLGCLFISGIATDFPLLALQNSLLVICYGFLLYGLRNSRLSPLWLCRGIVWVGVISAIISLALWQPAPDMWLSDNFYDALRNHSPLGHHNFTGGYFLLILPVAVGMAWLHSRWWRWGYGVMGLLIAVALYASGSRGAWLGGIVVMLLALGGCIVCSRGKTRILGGLLAVLALCLAMGVLASNPRIRSLVSVSTPESTRPAIVADGPTRDRFFMAQAALNVLSHQPWGVGAGNLGRVYEPYRPVAAGTGLSQVQQLHNTPLQIAVELGLPGVVLYLGTWICLVRLVWQLQCLALPKERQLGLIVIMGFMGYGVSSLSDYQLENIPISVTLTVLLVSLLKLGGAQTSFSLTQAVRRWGSFLLFATTVLVIQFWLRSDLALWMTHQGLDLIRQGELSQADDKFYTASILAPWEPTPAALGAQQLSTLAQTANDENQRLLREEAMDLYRQILQIAPNDLWFNQNLAVVAWQLGDMATAQSAITKVVQLSPRSRNYSYYLLGLIYQASGNTNAAIEAFALECLINPHVLALENWQQELAVIKDAVFRKVLQHYQTILTSLEPNHSLKQPLADHIALLNWWFDVDHNVTFTEDSRLLLKILLTMEKAPDQAVQLLEQCIADVPNDESGCRLLKAWLQPQYLPDYLKTIGLGPEEQESLRSHITHYRRLQAWLRSTTQPISDNQRVAVWLLYRSYYAQNITSILIPDNLRQFSLLTSLNLFSLVWPREFPPLDNLVETLRSEALGLPHPTRNNFKLTAPEF